MRWWSTERQATKTQSPALCQDGIPARSYWGFVKLGRYEGAHFRSGRNVVDRFFDALAFQARNETDCLKLTWLRTIVLGCSWSV